MKRALLAILGTILIIVGVGTAGVGGTLAALTGPDAAISGDAGKVSGNGYALVFNEFTINAGADTKALKSFVDFKMGAKSTTGSELFLGIAPAEAVNGYLQTTARDIVSDLSGGTARVVPVPGKTVPAKPSEQTIWTAQSQGINPTISLNASGANSTLVIMNADAQQQLSVDVTIGVESPAIFPVGLGLIFFGVLLLVLGIWVVVIAFKPRDDAMPPPAPMPLYPADPLPAQVNVPGAGTAASNPPAAQQPMPPNPPPPTGDQS